MVLVRAQIPALVKRAYSEDVNYDFTKIDDFFRFLTPAMNQFKVNFDIESETATKRNEQGNPVFVEYLPQSQLWMYEADLGLRWTNAENAEDMIQVTIHAIGTHEMPEKAKGSAWTYSLKYYLLDKYCIDQGGEDPDMRRMQPVYEDTEKLMENELGEGWEESSESPFDEGQELYLEDNSQLSVEEQQFAESGEEQFFEEVVQEAVQKEETAEKRNPKLRQDQGQMVMLPESAKSSKEARTKKASAQIASERTETGRMTVEEACKVVCSCGLNRGKLLGELAQGGPEGIKNLQWYAKDYRGRDEKLREGARVLLEAAAA